MNEHLKPASNGALQPLRALRALRTLLADPENTESVFHLLDALRGRSSERNWARLQREAPDLATRRPELLGVLTDREHLASLPPGSLGREYLAFIDREGITPDGLVAASTAARREGEDAKGWLERRGRDSHDLWHVITGYGTNTLGEMCVVGFTWTQTRHLGLGVIALAGAFKHVESLGWRGSFGPLFEALRNGRRARWLHTMPWEELLATPLDEVRATLGIPAPQAYDAALPHAAWAV